MIDGVTHEQIEGCVEKWDVDVDGQLHCLGDELGEVHEAWLSDGDLGEELGDMNFILHTIEIIHGVQASPPKEVRGSEGTDELIFELHDRLMSLRDAIKVNNRIATRAQLLRSYLYTIASEEGINLSERTREVTRENLQKSAEKDGDKVTKE